MTERDKSRYTEGSVNIGGSVVVARRLRFWLRFRIRRLDPDHGQIDQWVFNLSQRKPHALCLEEHVKLSVADVVITLTTVRVTTTSNPHWSSIEGLKLKLVDLK
ncbi:hypothetical protein EVAR_31886_1 [Eumeta japonica]|uniref:Uncharacterized protein n=1 Tax=Eumeta variegata TaxID=151549 RepID=A0A4C1WV04_EUMVA|nr:hypothetical protein EVAR_31886_1 [Eumeta japonica]